MCISRPSTTLVTWCHVHLKSGLTRNCHRNKSRNSGRRSNMATMKCRCDIDECRKRCACKKFGNGYGVGCGCYAYLVDGIPPCGNPFTKPSATGQPDTIMERLFGVAVPPFLPLYPSFCFAGWVAKETNWRMVDEMTVERMFEFVFDAAVANGLCLRFKIPWVLGRRGGLMPGMRERWTRDRRMIRRGWR
ncbi:hypothetical protein B0T21DRAFT_354304 [Apiosordaria backusii]|uniref:Uncharacterized protein n=1 Tax=Apiosordaria backusii TaxID=314023 RepID=A0AA40EXN1_9PEZI|nr:hypothetical protein B0T21DRAFT_354304 [Apiosordaria backusii]